MQGLSVGIDDFQSVVGEILKGIGDDSGEELVSNIIWFTSYKFVAATVTHFLYNKIYPNRTHN